MKRRRQTRAFAIHFCVFRGGGAVGWGVVGVLGGGTRRWLRFCLFDADDGGCGAATRKSCDETSFEATPRTISSGEPRSTGRVSNRVLSVTRAVYIYYYRSMEVVSKFTFSRVAAPGNPCSNLLSPRADAPLLAQLVWRRPRPMRTSCKGTALHRLNFRHVLSK